MSNKDSHVRHLDAALYVPAGQRVDCCGRCRWSVPASGQKLACRKHGSAEVAKWAICAQWEPVGRRVPCQAPGAAR